MTQLEKDYWELSKKYHALVLEHGDLKKKYEELTGKQMVQATEEGSGVWYDAK